jgi:UDP-N-acetylmuramoyl-tripeptide--D-alanyl-D-alanine ligase
MGYLTSHDLICLSGGRWLPDGPSPERMHAPLGRVVIDSRDVTPGDVFWALPGTRRHGANFIQDASRRGASRIVTDRIEASPIDGQSAFTAILPESRPLTPEPCSDPCCTLLVDDSQRALWRAATAQRRRFTGRVVAVTGSVGKTTTRDMIQAVLGCRYQGQASERNYNNQLGVPLSLLNWRADDYAVVELAASAVGEIAQLAELTQPHIGVITRIGEAHLAGFGSRARLADAKGELLQALPDDGLAVLNGDDIEQRRLGRRLRTPIVWFGRGADCDITATKIQSRGGRLTLEVNGQTFSVPAWGRHHTTSVLAAVAVGRAMGVSAGEMAEALADFQPPPMRCEVSRVGQAQVINDCYNASPTSMRAALDLLREFEAPGRRIVVCGDMRELGADEAAWHRELGDEVVTRCGADLLVACGEQAEHVVAGARESGMPAERALACRGPLEAARRLAPIIHDGDVVLVKGSRALAMERFVTALVGDPT